MEEIDKVTGDVMRYMIFRHYKEPGVPVKREDLVEEVNKVYKNRRGVAGQAISEAQNKFPAIFGFEMKELQRTRQVKNPRVRSPQAGEGPTAKSYVLRSTLPVEVRRKFVETPETTALKALALVITSLIKLEGDKIEDKDLWTRLARLGVHLTDENHPRFGRVGDAIQTLMKQRYFQLEKVSVGDEASLFYELAENALDEFGEEKMKNYIAKTVDAEVES